jgi:hypothetical protein
MSHIKTAIRLTERIASVRYMTKLIFCCKFVRFAYCIRKYALVLLSYAHIEPVSVVVTLSSNSRLSRRPFGLSTNYNNYCREFVVVFFAVYKKMLAGQVPLLGNDRFLRKSTDPPAIGRTVWSTEGRKMKPKITFEPNNTFVVGTNIAQLRKIKFEPNSTFVLGTNIA